MVRLYGPLEACLEPVSGQRGRVSTPASSAEGQAKRRHRGARPRRVMTLSDAPGRGSWAGLRAQGCHRSSLASPPASCGRVVCRAAGVACKSAGGSSPPPARVRDSANVSVSAATPALLHSSAAPLQRSTAASRGRRPWPWPSHSRLRH